MTNKLVTDEQYGKISKRAHELILRVSNGGSNLENSMEGLQLLIENRSICDKRELYTDLKLPNWISHILSWEARCHFKFFGKEFDLSEFERVLKKYSQENFIYWNSLGLEPHYLPPVVMSQDVNFPGWYIKPNDWFYEQIKEEKILRMVGGKLVPDETVLNLGGTTILVDTRCKPFYKEGRQIWENDNLCGEIILKLREENKIKKYEYGEQSSRFSISSDEFEDQVKTEIAKKLGLSVENMRLERAIEMNSISQIYTYMPRKSDNQTNTSVWLQEFFGSFSRLFGGNSDYGGLSHVSYINLGLHWFGRSLRVAAVLKP